MERKNNIILVGFMGTGKTTTGTALAGKLSWKFVDTDKEIERSTGMSIPQIFETHGEDWFREQETAVIAKVLSGTKQVISTGGGAVLREENRRQMLQGGLVAALTADLETIIRRVGENDTRPLLQGKARERVMTLLNARKDAYRFAPLTLDTTKKSPDQLANEIIQYYQQQR